MFPSAPYTQLRLYATRFTGGLPFLSLVAICNPGRSHLVSLKKTQNVDRPCCVYSSHQRAGSEVKSLSAGLSGIPWSDAPCVLKPKEHHLTQQQYLNRKVALGQGDSGTTGGTRISRLPQLSINQHGIPVEGLGNSHCWRNWHSHLLCGR